MKFQVAIGERMQSVELGRGASGWECRIDGQPRVVDVAEVAPGIFSLLLGGRSYTVGLERSGDAFRIHACGTDLVVEVQNPRRWARHAGALGTAGRQEVTAPMPGKVVRVLVAQSQEVEEGQGTVVVEAMKMQNEIPSHRKGVVERVLVREGETVEHGQVLVVIA